MTDAVGERAGDEQCDSNKDDATDRSRLVLTQGFSPVSYQSTEYRVPTDPEKSEKLGNFTLGQGKYSTW